MLKRSKGRSQNVSLIQLSAFHLPFQNEVYDGVVSILGDSYALPKGFREIWRILRCGGSFVIALPSKFWASVLRPKIGMPIDKTIFLSSSHEAVVIPSFLYSESELIRHLLDAEFVDVEVRSFSVRGSVEESELSAHVLIPSIDLEISPYDLPLVTIAFARKTGEEDNLDELQGERDSCQRKMSRGSV
jgi:SAM-dependent methyltransferase